MRRVMITGATGMIAVALINQLIKEDTEVYAVCRPNSSKYNNIPKDDKIKIVECDISELLTLEGKFEEEFDAFYHFGWAGTFGDSRNDAFLQNLNVKYTLDAVKLAKSIGCKCFIGAGSQAEYGPKNEKISSETLVNPENGYGVAKYSAGKFSRILAKQLGIRHMWVRIFSIYGPNDNDFTMVMSSIKKLMNRERPVYTKGEQLWDYLYCDDAARAIDLMARKGKDGAVYCLGSSKVKPLKEYITTIRDSIVKDLELGFGEVEYSPNQVMYLCADIDNLTNDTGFEPNVTFEEGIKKTIEWYKSKNGISE